MLSISKMGKGSALYYAKLAQNQGEFDASQPGEPPGEWLGRGAATLGLTGTVNQADFLALFDGFSTDGQAFLANAGRDNHVPGWDLTFSSVKSVGGLLWAVAPAHIKATLESCHHRAVKRAIAYLEEQAVNRNGEQCNLVIAAFQHGSNRNLDPGLHTHCLVLNLAVGQMAGEKPRPLYSKHLYKHKRAAGALYRSEFSYLLQQELGLSLERVRSWFELKGFSRERGRYQELMNHWSSRRQEIETQEPVNARHAQLLAYQTRQEKGVVPPRHELFAQWQDTAAEYGLTQRQAIRLVKPPKQPLTLTQKWAEWRTIREAATAVIRHQSHFTHRELVQAVAEASQARTISADRVMELTEWYLTSRYVMRLGIIDGQKRYANKRLYRLEQKLLNQAQTLKQSRGYRVRTKTVTQAVMRHGIRPEQEQAIVTVTQPSRLSVLSGLTGTGKTHTVKVLRDIYQANGHEVLGVAASRRGMEKLHEKTELSHQRWWEPFVEHPSEQTMSVHRLFTALDRAQESQWQYGARSVVRSPLSNRTVVIVDDAQRINTAQMNRLITEVNQAAAKLILCGDLKQQQSYEHRGAFAAIAQRFGHIQLEHVVRQEEEQAQTIVQQISEGESQAVVRRLVEQGQLIFVEHKEEAMLQTVQQWKPQGIRHPRQHLMITETREDAKTLNRLAQQARVESGALSQVAVKVRGDHFYKGDRLLLAESSHTYGVTKGTFGTLKHLDSVTRMAVVKLDSGQTRFINTRLYRGLELGYAVTTTTARDIEVNYAYVMAHGDGREAALVQLSRAQKQTQVIAYGHGVEHDQTQNLADQLKYSKLQEFAVIAHERGKEQAQEQGRSH